MVGPCGRICCSVFCASSSPQKFERKNGETGKRGVTADRQKRSNNKIFGGTHGQNTKVNHQPLIRGTRSKVNNHCGKKTMLRHDPSLFNKNIITEKSESEFFSHASSPQKILKENGKGQQIFWNRSSAVRPSTTPTPGAHAEPWLSIECVLGGQLSSQQDFVLSQPLSVTD